LKPSLNTDAHKTRKCSALGKPNTALKWKTLLSRLVTLSRTKNCESFQGKSSGLRRHWLKAVSKLKNVCTQPSFIRTLLTSLFLNLSLSTRTQKEHSSSLLHGTQAWLSFEKTVSAEWKNCARKCSWTSCARSNSDSNKNKLWKSQLKNKQRCRQQKSKSCSRPRRVEKLKNRRQSSR